MKRLKRKKISVLALFVFSVITIGILFTAFGDFGEPVNRQTEAKDSNNAKDDETKTEDAKDNDRKTTDTIDDGTSSSDGKTSDTEVTDNDQKSDYGNSNDKKTNHEKNNGEKTETTKEYKTIANLNLRKESSKNHEVITTIPKGERVTYIATSGTWFEVEYGNQTGFVSSEYLKATSKATTLPATEEEIKPTYIQGVLIANKEYPLPAEYAPGESNEARQAFNEMAEVAKKDGVGLYAFSTYRSYAVQKQLYDQYVTREGKVVADRYSARPGHSEHQTGLAFDICEEGQYNNRFEESKATRWLAENAYKYGFILRYPEGKEHITGYMYEPWHYRYLGTEIAIQVFNSRLTLEEFLKID